MSETDLSCPICDKKAQMTPPAFPFCSLRCKAIDMGSWLDGSYEDQLLGEGLEDESAPFS